MDARPRIALTVGDPAGIGPEVVHACLRDAALRERMRLIVLGPERLRPENVQLGSIAAVGRDDRADDALWLATEAAEPWELGRAQAAAGEAALAALRTGADLARAGRVDALVTGPVSKEALHLAGERVEGQTELLARWDRTERIGMLAVAGSLRTMPLTRHLPLRAALDAVTPERIGRALDLLHGGMAALGFRRPRLALAGLNPHAGESGLLGWEEQELLAPAVEEARARGVDVAGPISPDSVFLQCSRGDFDAVLALYHDQAFIPVKLHAPRGGVTVLLGLSYLRVSPAHGTAFDIVGKGAADPSSLTRALRAAADWAGAYDPARSFA